MYERNFLCLHAALVLVRVYNRTRDFFRQLLSLTLQIYIIGT